MWSEDYQENVAYVILAEHFSMEKAACAAWCFPL